MLALLPVVVACGGTVVVADGVGPTNTGYGGVGQGGGAGSPAGRGGATNSSTSPASSGGAGNGATTTTNAGTTTSSTAATSTGPSSGATSSSSGTPASGGGGASASGTSGSGGSGGEDAGTVTVGPGFHLLGVYWTGSELIVDLVDPTTGKGAPVGQLGQLGGWSGNIVLNADGTRVYGIGNPYGSFVNKLVTLDLTSGIWSDVTTAQSQMYVLAGVTDDEHVIGVFWNGSVEEVDLVDPTTGEGTSVGQLGDLHTWPDQLVYDHAANTVYAWGSNQANAQFLYSLNLDTHASAAVPASAGSWSYPFGGVAWTGAVVGMTWNGTAEAVMSLDPTTGVATPEGTLAGLHDIAQNGSIAYDASAGIAYAVGTPAGSSASTIYTLDLATAQGTAVVAEHTYTLARP